jgi:Berberine and berberine like
VSGRRQLDGFTPRIRGDVRRALDVESRCGPSNYDSNGAVGGVRRGAVAELRAPSGATVFGRRLRQLPEANSSPSRYFGPNLSQLTTVRQKYDPNRVMYSGLNI